MSLYFISLGKGHASASLSRGEIGGVVADLFIQGRPSIEGWGRVAVAALHTSVLQSMPQPLNSIFFLQYTSFLSRFCRRSPFSPPVMNLLPINTRHSSVSQQQSRLISQEMLLCCSPLRFSRNAP